MNGIVRILVKISAGGFKSVLIAAEFLNPPVIRSGFKIDILGDFCAARVVKNGILRILNILRNICFLLFASVSFFGIKRRLVHNKENTVLRHNTVGFRLLAYVIRIQNRKKISAGNIPILRRLNLHTVFIDFHKFRKQVTAKTLVIHVKIHGKPFRCIGKSHFITEEQGNSVPEQGGIVAVCQKRPFLSLSHAEQIGFFFQFNLVRLFIRKHPGGISPSADIIQLHTV